MEIERVSAMLSVTGSLDNLASEGRSPFLTCNICGKQFGTASLRIHQPQCLQVLANHSNNLCKPITLLIFLIYISQAETTEGGKSATERIGYYSRPQCTQRK